MRSFLLAGVSATALCALPSLAAALTPEEAWASWQELAEEAGVTVTSGSEAVSGARLTVSDVAFSADFEEEDTRLDGTVAEIVFAQTGTGSVEVTMSEMFPVTITGTDFEGADVVTQLTVSQPGFLYTVSADDAGAIDAIYTMPSVGMSIDSITSDGEVEDFTGAMTATEIEGAYAVSGGAEDRTVSNTVTAAGLSMAFSGTDPDSDQPIAFTLEVADIASQTESTNGSIYAFGQSLSELIADGFTTTGTGSAGPATFRMIAEGPEGFDVSGALAGGAGAVDIDDTSVAYDVTYRGLEFTAAGPQFPVPEISGALGEWQTSIAMPATQAEEASPFNLTLALRDLTLGDGVWALFDPGAALERGPATLVVDLAGQMKLLTDVFSGDAMMMGGPPAELDTLDLRELRLSVAGAELTGAGEFALDNSGASPFGPGLPAVDGTVNLSLSGAMGLMGTLVQMGLVPQQQAAFAQMALGMVALPGEGPDTFVSEITVRPDGTILANGAPLPF